MFRLTRSWDPWRDLERLQEEMNRVFSDVRGPSLARRGEFPAVNIWQGEDGLALTSELPGLDLDGLDITVAGDTVTLRGTRSAEELKEGTSVHRQERAATTFSRTLQLPYGVETERTDAVYENGVLTVKLYRSEAQKPKRITVKAG